MNIEFLFQHVPRPRPLSISTSLMLCAIFGYLHFPWYSVSPFILGITAVEAVRGMTEQRVKRFPASLALALFASSTFFCSLVYAGSCHLAPVIFQGYNVCRKNSRPQLLTELAYLITAS